MAWIQDGGSNPWYANFNNTALDFITFNGVQVWASSYSFSITVSYKVGAIGFAVDISDPSDCESEYTNNILSYVSRFSISVSNVVGCDEIYFNPMGISGILDKMKFDDTYTWYEAIWSNRDEHYCIETNDQWGHSFLIDRFYRTDTTPVPVGVGYSLYGNGNYHTVSSVQADPSVNSSTKPNGAVTNPNRALKYYHSIDLPGSYYYEEQMDTSRWYNWGIISDGVYVPLTIQRGRMIKYIYPYISTYQEASLGPTVNQGFTVLNASRTLTVSNTKPTSGAWT